MTSIADVTNALNREFQEPLSDLVARSNPMLAAVRKVSMVPDRIWLKQRLSSDHNAGAIPENWNAVTSGFATEPKSTFSQAVLDWATYKAEVQIPKRLMKRISANPGLIGNLLQDEITQATLDMLDEIAKDMFGGVTTNGLVGLETIMDTDRAYAGLNSSTPGNEEWDGIVVDASPDGTAAGELSTTLLYNGNTAYFGRNKRLFFAPGINSAAFTSAIMLQKYMALFQSIDFGSLSESHFINQADASNFLGKSGVGFVGTPFIPDSWVGEGTGDIDDTNRIYAVVPSELYLANMSSMIDDPGIAMKQQEMGVRAGIEREGLDINIEVLGNSGELLQMYVKTYIQLAAPSPKKAGIVFKNIDTALT